LSGSEKKQGDTGEGTKRSAKEGGRAWVKARWVPNAGGSCLARNRRSPKRPSEPRGQAASTRKRRSGRKTRSYLEVRSSGRCGLLKDR